MGKLRTYSVQFYPTTSRYHPVLSRFTRPPHNDREFTIGFRCMARKYASLSANYDNQYGWGAGLTFHY
ncbi:hypothetical protein [Hymenobacter lapidarius]|uniref:hypothetical protein n=1 Tax=Hymenobacter lapidarius TaxID=1908237 RepID=UPI000F7966A9|nr:hypothetical protein [Hymenobacter lapidarius]